RQIANWNLPTREPKRKSAADKNWEYDFACELDAIPPDQLRELVESFINQHLPQDRLQILKVAEQSEREIIQRLVGRKTKRQPKLEGARPKGPRLSGRRQTGREKNARRAGCRHRRHCVGGSRDGIWAL